MTRSISFLSLALAATLLPGSAKAATREVKKSVSAGEGLRVDVENLAGRVTLEAAPGDQAEVVAVLHAEGRDDKETQELLSALDVDFETTGGRFSARVRYPLEAHATIRYPRPGAGSDDDGFLSTLFGNFSRSSVEYQGRRVSVVTARSHHAPVLFADLVIRLPRGASVTVKNAVGEVRGGDAPAAVTVHTGEADVNLSRIAGRVEVETGSGDVLLRGLSNGARVQTGSGDVVVERAEGPLAFETGSGDITLRDVAGALRVETGSGEVTARGFRATDRLNVETASGNVSLAGDLSGLREAALETASGDVTLALASSFPMRLVATTASGERTVSLPGLRTLRESDHELVAETGNGGVPLTIETASGDLEISAR